MNHLLSLLSRYVKHIPGRHATPPNRSRRSGTRKPTRWPPCVESLETRELLSAAFLGAFVPSQLGGLDSPRGLLFGPDGNLFVASGNSDAILRYDGTSGNLLGAFVGPSSGGLDQPYDLVFGPDGNLFVSSTLTNEILRYDGSTGSFLGRFVGDDPLTPSIDESGGLSDPRGITFGGDGNLYVASNLTDQILKYRGPNNGSDGHPAGEFLGTFAVTGPGSTPDNLAFGPDGNLFVGCPQFGTPTPSDAVVNRYDEASGAFIDTFIPSGRGGLADNRAIFFDRAGNLIVADPAQRAVLRYQGPSGAAPGAFIDTLIPSGLGGLNVPIGIRRCA